MIGHLDRLAGFIRRQDLQIGRDDGAVAVERDMRQAGEVREAAGNRGLVALAFEIRRDRLVAGGAGQVRAAVEHAIFGIDGLGIGRGAGIGARRVAGDQIIDFQPILDGAHALFEACVLSVAPCVVPRIVIHAYMYDIHYHRLRMIFAYSALPESGIVALRYQGVNSWRPAANSIAVPFSSVRAPRLAAWRSALPFRARQ